MKRISALIWALLFVVFAIFQYNDPDSWTWILIYGAAASLSMLVFFDKLNRAVLWLALFGFLAGAFFLWPDTYRGLTLDKGFTPAIEEARESLGLAICSLSMAWLLFCTKIRQMTDS